MRIEYVVGLGCLNCEKEIPIEQGIEGKMLCSVRCMKEINKLGGHYDLEDVVKK